VNLNEQMGERGNENIPKLAKKENLRIFRKKICRIVAKRLSIYNIA
jgi:hypothetical protein